MSQDMLYINGEFRSRGSAQVIDPSTGHLLREVPMASRQDITDALNAAREAFDKGPWPGLPLEQRKEFLNRISQGILDEAADLAFLETANTGKPIKESTFMDVPSAARVFGHYASRLGEYLEERSISTEAPFATRSILAREPLGVVAIIVPWNYPLLIACWKIAAALAAGNTVVVKPSTLTPLSAFALGRIIHAAGLPRGVVNIVNASGDDAQECLVSSDKVDMISFTGSNEVGRRIMSATANRVKKLLLELGGKSASIITRDADIETAVNATLCSCFLNQGQMCTAMSRVYVAHEIYRQFVSSFVDKAKRIKLGPGSDFETQMGPLICARQVNDVHALVQGACAQGARALCGGAPCDDPDLRGGFFYPPTVLEGVMPTMPLFRQEVFGPVCSVHQFSDEHEALAMANDSDFGLAACVWSGDADHARDLARGLDAGTVWINTYGMFLDELPYGGFKQSGFGKELGREGLWEYTRLKNTITDASADKPLVHYWYGL